MLESGGTWQEVARLADVPIGGIVPVVCGGEAILLCRTSSGVFAVADRCSHASQPMRNGRIRGQSLVCPVHGARFALVDGAPINGPARQPVKTFPVRIDGDAVFVTAQPS
jgi:3-phenylpropionate/trans-cinnamate dioxygenase ferredoxin subunit